jgi:DNA-binding NtrC family response regulator
VQVLKYPSVPESRTESEFEYRLEQLSSLAKGLATEIEALQAELTRQRRQPKQIDFEKDGIDFYGEVERFEIELIRDALKLCNGNQSQAAKLLQLKSTTLNAKMKHYGLNVARSISPIQPNS